MSGRQTLKEVRAIRPLPPLLPNVPSTHHHTVPSQHYSITATSLIYNIIFTSSIITLPSSQTIFTSHLSTNTPNQIKMPSYQITEPHPHVGAYTYSGRGGAGNVFKVGKTSDASTARGPASIFGTLPQSSSKFSSGRGGAGNIHNSSERTVFSFDDELERQASRETRAKEMGTVYSVGRGGAGNYASARPQPSSSRKDSSSSNESQRSGFLGRLSHTLERR